MPVFGLAFNHCQSADSASDHCMLLRGHPLGRSPARACACSPPVRAAIEARTTPVHRSPPSYSQEADAALSELQYQKLFATAGGSRVTIYELMPDGSFEPLQVRTGRPCATHSRSARLVGTRHGRR